MDAAYAERTFVLAWYEPDLCGLDAILTGRPMKGGMDEGGFRPCSPKKPSLENSLDFTKVVITWLGKRSLQSRLMLS
jgi:hypothetical protein